MLFLLILFIITNYALGYIPWISPLFLHQDKTIHWPVIIIFIYFSQSCFFDTWFSSGTFSFWQQIVKSSEFLMTENAFNDLPDTKGDWATNSDQWETCVSDNWPITGLESEKLAHPFNLITQITTNMTGNAIEVLL